MTNGGLRRKRAADFDLSDSDDEVEAKRRRKRNEFARMRKALLQDENIGKIGKLNFYFIYSYILIASSRESKEVRILTSY